MNLMKLFPLCAVFALSGCANLLPSTDKMLPAEDTIPPKLGSQVVTGDVMWEILEWRKVVRDERLKQLLELAIENNRDLRRAALNIDAARAQYRIADARRLPTVTSAASLDIVKDTNVPVSRSATVSVGVAAWEIDFWGRLGSLRDAALATYLGTEQTRHAMQAALISETAQAWLTLAANEQQVRLAQQTLANRQESMQLVSRRRMLGAATNLEMATAEAGMEAARGELAVKRTAYSQSLNALRVLVGREVPEALLPDEKGESDVAALVNVPANLPSSVLLRRPDIRAAEAALEAARASVASARAALFPTISLTATSGFASKSLGDLVIEGRSVWSFGPTISIPILDGGVSRAQLESATVDQKLRLASYEQTLQVAFKEVSDALAVRATLDERLNSQQAQVAAFKVTLNLVKRRQHSGSESSLAVLDAQRSLYEAQQNLILLRLTEQANRLMLFRALGGG